MSRMFIRFSNMSMISTLRTLSRSVTNSNARKGNTMSLHAQCSLGSFTAVKHNVYLITLLVRIFAGTTKSKQQNNGRAVWSPW